jgi:hypothetical protein
MANSIFQISLRRLPGNQILPAEGATGHKEGEPISIFGSAYDKKKNGNRGLGTGHLGITDRLAECRKQVKYVPPTK